MLWRACKQAARALTPKQPRPRVLARAARWRYLFLLRSHSLHCDMQRAVPMGVLVLGPYDGNGPYAAFRHVLEVEGGAEGLWRGPMLAKVRRHHESTPSVSATLAGGVKGGGALARSLAGQALLRHAHGRSMPRSMILRVLVTNPVPVRTDSLM